MLFQVILKIKKTFKVVLHLGKQPFTGEQEEFCNLESSVAKHGKGTSCLEGRGSSSLQFVSVKISCPL